MAAKGGDALCLRFFQRRRLFDADRMEANAIPRFHLAHFPQFGSGDGNRADEAAQAGAVVRQDHRKVAGKVHRTNGVFAVVDVRGVQTGFAAVGAGPGRFRPNQAHAKTIGVVVHLPVAGKKLVDSGLSEEVRRAVRAVEYADAPLAAVMRHQHLIQRLRRADRRRRGAGRQPRLGDRQHIRHAQRASGMAAKLAERKGGAAAQVFRHVEPVANRQISAATALGAAYGQGLPGFHLNGLPVGQANAI